MGCSNTKVEVKENEDDKKKIDTNIPYQDILTDS